MPKEQIISDEDNSVSVYVRIRSYPDLTENKICTSVTKDRKTIIIKGTKIHEYTFDRIFTESSFQNEIFSVVALPIVNKILQGYNATIFAYGQTGSGKTYTMAGSDIPNSNSLETSLTLNADNFDSDTGIIPRCVARLFDGIERVKLVEPQTEFFVTCSFLEVYNERIFDLVDYTNTQLHPRERNGLVRIEGLSEIPVETAEEGLKVFLTGTKNRRVGSTQMNIESSRSHSVFMLQVSSKRKEGELWTTRIASLNLVDLAGSERQSKTATAGESLKEAAQINQSLSALGKVIKSLAEASEEVKRTSPGVLDSPKTKNKTRAGRPFISYRDSKLTFILKDSLGGNSYCSIIATVSPLVENFSETLSTSHFALSAKSIQNNVRLNENKFGSEKAMVSENKKLQEKIFFLEEENRRLKEAPLSLASSANTTEAHVLGIANSVTSFQPSKEKDKASNDSITYKLYLDKIKNFKLLEDELESLRVLSKESEKEMGLMRVRLSLKNRIVESLQAIVPLENLGYSQVDEELRLKGITIREGNYSSGDKMQFSKEYLDRWSAQRYEIKNLEKQLALNRKDLRLFVELYEVKRELEKFRFYFESGMSLIELNEALKRNVEGLVEENNRLEDEIRDLKEMKSISSLVNEARENSVGPFNKAERCIEIANSFASILNELNKSHKLVNKGHVQNLLFLCFNKFIYLLNALLSKQNNSCERLDAITNKTGELSILVNNYKNVSSSFQENETSSFKKIISSLKLEKIELSSELSELSKNFDLTVAELEGKEEELSILQEDIGLKEKELKESKEEIKNLQAKIVAAESLSHLKGTGESKALQKLEQMMEETSKLKKENGSFAKELKEAEETKKELSERIRAFEGKMEAFSDLQSKHSETAQSLREKEKELICKEEEFKNSLLENEEYLEKEIQKVKADAQFTLDEKELEHSRKLEEIKNQHEVEKRGLQDVIEQSFRNFVSTECQRRDTIIQKEKAEKETLQGELENEREKASQREMENELLNRSYSEAQKALRESREQLSRLEDDHRKVEELEGRIAMAVKEKEHVISILKEKEEKILDGIRKTDSLRAEKARLEEQLRKQKKEAEEKEGVIEKLSEERVGILKNQEDLKNRAEGLLKDIEELRKGNSALSKQIKQVEGQKNDLTEQINTHREKNESLQETLALKEQLIEECKKKIGELVGPNSTSAKLEYWKDIKSENMALREANKVLEEEIKKAKLMGSFTSKELSEEGANNYLQKKNIELRNNNYEKEKRLKGVQDFVRGVCEEIGLKDVGDLEDLFGSLNKCKEKIKGLMVERDKYKGKVKRYEKLIQKKKVDQKSGG